jgi:CDP-diacylglycerol--serine O-phosphatidyltransferase
MIIINAAQQRFEVVVIWACLALVSDFLDGFAARFLKVSSELGGQLDSLSDLISFGVAPAMVLFYFFNAELEQNWSYVFFIIPILAAYRLAKFNVESQSLHFFKGLATPAMALFCFSIPMIQNETVSNVFYHKFFITTLVVFLSLLMISSLKLFSLKPDFSDKLLTRIQLIFLTFCIILIIAFGYFGITLSIVWYIVFSFTIQNKIT